MFLIVAATLPLSCMVGESLDIFQERCLWHPYSFVLDRIARLCLQLLHQTDFLTSLLSSIANAIGGVDFRFQ